MELLVNKMRQWDKEKIKGYKSETRSDITYLCSNSFRFNIIFKFII